METTVKCTKRYRGPFGHFEQGDSRELNPHLAEQLPKSHFEIVDKAVDKSPKDKQTRPGKNGSAVQTK